MNEKTEYEKEWFQDLGVLILCILSLIVIMIYFLLDQSLEEFRFLAVVPILFCMLILGFVALFEYIDMETINKSQNADSERFISDYIDKLILGIWWIGNAGVWIYVFVFHKQFIIEFGSAFLWVIAIGIGILTLGTILILFCIIVRHALKDNGD